MTYKITDRCLALVSDLFDGGYDGDARLTRRYPSGAANFLAGVISIELTGFCKETLYLVEDTDTNNILFVGRYNEEDVEPTGAGIVAHAWTMYRSYKTSGYSIPTEFTDLFKKHGYLKQKVVPEHTVWEEE